jgi:hypothetical protein
LAKGVTAALSLLTLALQNAQRRTTNANWHNTRPLQVGELAGRNGSRRP